LETNSSHISSGFTDNQIVRARPLAWPWRANPPPRRIPAPAARGPSPRPPSADGDAGGDEAPATADGRAPSIAGAFSSSYNHGMKIPAHLRVYRDPLIENSALQTYTLQINALCQFQWDYILDWPAGEAPKIWISTYRCFQRMESSAEFQIAENVPFDIPVWDEVVRGIAQAVAEVLYRSCRIVGPIVPVSADYHTGAEEAANKRFDMHKYRAMKLGGRTSEEDKNEGK
jgi:hypothetical protein